MAEEEGSAGGVFGDRGGDFHFGFGEEGERGGDGSGCHGGLEGGDGDEFVVAAKALGVGFSEEERGFGEGAEFGCEVWGWDVWFAFGERRPCFCRLVG